MTLGEVALHCGDKHLAYLETHAGIITESKDNLFSYFHF